MQYYDKHKEQVLELLESSERGLGSSEARKRLSAFGLNRLVVRGDPWWRIAFEPFRSVFIAILGFAAVISIYKQETIDAVIIITIIMVSAIIYYVQRFSTDRVLRALKKHDAQNVQVWRDRQVKSIDAELLVPGDVYLLAEGEKIPADARILHAENVRVDEAMLTGESEPVAKHYSPLQSGRQIYEQTNMLFQGSFIVSGTVTAVVTATGNITEYGRLAQLAGTSGHESPVQQKIDQLITRIVIAVIGSALVVFALNIFRGYEASEALRFVLALAVSAVPEGLPIAISVILVLGMRRIARKKALVRSMAAIENIGLVTLIASDKTGTLTKNQLKVQDVWELEPQGDLKVVARHLARSAAIVGGGKNHDPLDEAFVQFASEYHAETAAQPEKVLPFDQAHAMSGAMWHEKNQYVGYYKGAPEKILSASHLNVHQKKTIEHELHSLTGQGLRVIALAQNTQKRVAENFDEVLEVPLEFIALVAVADELRSEAPQAIREAREAGVQVAMITGDHAETAYAIGRKIGLLEHRDEVLDSRDLEGTAGNKRLAASVYRSKVFARVTPENKYKLLKLFKKKHITAMTGDGVNDVPALTQAHIGIAMGSGTQVAKEAGDIVLLDNNFSTIVEALREGRVIFANIRRMLFYLLATSAGAVFTMLGALIIGMPLPVLAVQILWINLVTDTALVIPLGLEPAEDDVMKQPPRKPAQPILDRYMLVRMGLVAVTMAIVTLVIFGYFLRSYPEEYARTIAFTVLVSMQWANAFNARSDRASVFTRLKVFNGKFALGLTLSISLQLLALFGPIAAALHVVSVDTAQLLVSVGIACFAVVAVAELHKAWCRREMRSTI